VLVAVEAFLFQRGQEATVADEGPGAVVSEVEAQMEGARGRVVQRLDHRRSRRRRRAG
jgi:hypothetical protein